MFRLTIAVCVLCIIISTSPAGAGESKSFTNQDLKKYKNRSYDNHSARPESAAQPYVNLPPAEVPSEKTSIKHVVPYKVSEGTEMRIIIPVTFNRDITAKLLLDTGATGMYLSGNLAEKIGVFESSDVKLLWAAGGIGGTVPAIVTVIETISIGDMEYDFIPTTISDSAFSDFDGLVGMDFMTNYNIHIDTEKHEIVFEEKGESKDMPAGRTETWWRVTYRNFRGMRSAWEHYRKHLYSEDRSSPALDRLRALADSQYTKADDLLTRLDVYASMNSVPLEWR